MKPFVSALLATFCLAAAATAQEPSLRYPCKHAATPPRIDGDLSDEAWEAAPWTADFVDIRGAAAPLPRYRTRVKMLWDEHALYVCAKVSEPHVWATLTEKNAVIYQDNDFEIFLDPDGDGLNYYEFEINALGTIWELTLDKPYSQGGRATLGTNLPGLRRAVKVQGTLNDPTDEDQGWTVEILLPWSDLTRYLGRMSTPPGPDDVWRIDFSRVEWRHVVTAGRYVRQPPHGAAIFWTEHPEDNWVWNPTGAIDMHLPERWGRLSFER